ncbi:MAG: hypothetical protein K2O32_04640 [Acetatifactor sp.]|nr:hypothetical protein [Acetatifactor sp.]
MKDEEFEGKTLVFSPGGFVLKIIFTVAVTVGMGSVSREGMAESGGIAYVIFSYALYFVMFWFLATLFGFCLRATGNYIIAVILMLVLLGLLAFGSQWLTQKNPSAGVFAGIAFLLVLIWLPINDVRKAIIYFKNTI